MEPWIKKIPPVRWITAKVNESRRAAWRKEEESKDAAFKRSKTEGAKPAKETNK